MAITYKSQGAGLATETSGAACSPLCPATVDANDILIAHAYFEGTTTAPNTPTGWTLLNGPQNIGVTVVSRHWVYGKIADGTEDGAAVAFGSQAVTTMRAGRVYSFAGWVSGTITDLVNGFAATVHDTDPQMPTVTTTVAGALAVALVGQNDNNAQASPTGETGGDWVEAVAEFTAALTPGLALAIETATPTADPGTISGGAIATVNDPCGVIGFQIKAAASTISEADGSSTGTATNSVVGAAVWAAVTAAVAAAASSVIGAALWLTVTASSGLATDSVVGSAVAASLGSSNGIATVTANGDDAGGSTASAAGTAAGSVVGAALWASAGSAAGVSIDSAVGASTVLADGASSGTATDNVVGVRIVAISATAESVGAAGSAVVGGLLAAAVANSAGTGAATTDGKAILGDVSVADINRLIIKKLAQFGLV